MAVGGERVVSCFVGRAWVAVDTEERGLPGWQAVEVKKRATAVTSRVIRFV